MYMLLLASKATIWTNGKYLAVAYVVLKHYACIDHIYQNLKLQIDFMDQVGIPYSEYH